MKKATKALSTALRLRQLAPCDDNSDEKALSKVWGNGGMMIKLAKR
jgi:hypothetical protein